MHKYFIRLNFFILGCVIKNLQESMIHSHTGLCKIIHFVTDILFENGYHNLKNQLSDNFMTLKSV